MGEGASLGVFPWRRLVSSPSSSFPVLRTLSLMIRPFLYEMEDDLAAFSSIRLKYRNTNTTGTGRIAVITSVIQTARPHGG